jgi:hypothetical protein
MEMTKHQDKLVFQAENTETGVKVEALKKGSKILRT